MSFNGRFLEVESVIPRLELYLLFIETLQIKAIDSKMSKNQAKLKFTKVTIIYYLPSTVFAIIVDDSFTELLPFSSQLQTNLMHVLCT